MANLEGKLSQKGDAIYLLIAELYLATLNIELQKAKGQSLSVKQGYMSKYDLVDELRNMLKDKNTKPDGVGDAEWSEIQPLLDPIKSIEDIGKVKESYEKLQKFINNLASTKKGLFNPPLAIPFKTDKHKAVYPVPSSGAFDPRRYGRLLVVDKITDVGVKKWLTNNSPLYGFVMYEDYGLYFSELGKIKAEGNTKVNLAKLINQFQSTPIPITDITLDVSTLAAAEDALGIANDPVIDYPAGTVDNNGNAPELVRVDGQTVSKKIFDDYRNMFIAAKAAGITIKLTSGFRPATTGGSWTSQSGKTGTFSSQIDCRNYNLKKGITIPNKTLNGKWGERSGRDYVIYYTDSDTYFDPQTAAPGSSNHGTGLAVDLNTGKGNEAKNSPVYHWLAQNSWRYGFVRGVSTEEWHFEYLPALKQKQPTSPFDLVPQSNGLWYDIFANGFNAGGIDTSDLGVINPTPLRDTQAQGFVTKIAAMLRSIGMTQAGATGMIGNIIGESGALPWAYEKTNWTINGIGGVGIAQWTNTRRRAYEKYSGNNIPKMKSLDNQINWLKKELEGSYYGKVVTTPLKSTNSVEEATITVLEKFEVPGSYLNRNKGPEGAAKYLATKRKRIGMALGAAQYVAKAYV